MHFGLLKMYHCKILKQFRLVFVFHSIPIKLSELIIQKELRSAKDKSLEISLAGYFLISLIVSLFPPQINLPSQTKDIFFVKSSSSEYRTILMKFSSELNFFNTILIALQIISI